jgi:hypothetical protein
MDTHTRGLLPPVKRPGFEQTSTATAGHRSRSHQVTEQDESARAQGGKGQ